MKKTNKIVKEAAVLLFTAMLLTSFSAVVADTNETTINSREYTHVLGPSPLQDEVELGYYEEPFATSIGIGGGTGPYVWKSAIRLTQDEMGLYEGWNMTKVNVGFELDEGEGPVDITIYIYGKGTQTTPGPVIVDDTTYTLEDTGITTIELLTPVELQDYEELWVAIEWTQLADENVFYASMDNGPAVRGKGDWIYINNQWQETYTVGADFDRNWGIGAIIEGEITFTELTISDVKGPIGVSAEVKNAGVIVAENVVVDMTITGGILGMVNTEVSAPIATLAVGASEPIGSGPVIGIGPIDIVITASADNADEVRVERSGFLLGILVIGL